MTDMTIETDSGQVTVPGSHLLVALDETGHEQPDPSDHPVFGIGGCALPVRDYEASVRNPWLRLKERFLGGVDLPAHATDLEITPPRVEAIASFFREGSFGRIAILSSHETEKPDILPDFKVVARWVLEKIVKFVRLFDCDGVVLVHEESSRGDALFSRYFSGYSIVTESKMTTTTLPFLKYRMPKRSLEPFLEVADLIVHAAGGQVRTSRVEGEWVARRDFGAVFRDVPDELSEFLEITSAEL